MKTSIPVSAGIVGLAFLASVLTYDSLPAEMVTNWGASGDPDGSSARLVGAFALPVAMAALAVLLWALPSIDPRRERYTTFRPAYDWFVTALLAFLLYVHLLILLANLDVEFSFAVALVPAFAALFIGIGFLLERTEPNWFVGIRTPWTLEDERVWERTHRLGSRLFKLTGVVALGGIIVEQYWLVFVVGPVVATAVVLIVYSYWVFRELEG